MIKTNLDGIFIDISCEQTKQHVKLPIWLHLDKGFNLLQDKNGFLHVSSNIQSSTGVQISPTKKSGPGFFSSLFDFSSNQIINYLAFVSLILFIVLFLLKLKMPGSNQQPPIQSHRILNVTFTGSPTRLQQQQQQQQTLPGLLYRTTNLVSYSTSTPLNNFSNSTSQSSSYSTSKFSPQSLRNDVRLYSVDSDGPAYNDSTRYYNNNTI